MYVSICIVDFYLDIILSIPFHTNQTAACVPPYVSSCNIPPFTDYPGLLDIVVYLKFVYPIVWKYVCKLCWSSSNWRHCTNIIFSYNVFDKMQTWVI